jgi:N-acyl-D-aspartate/D-glutamate deacylase
VNITDHGILKADMWAEVVIFDPATVRDLAIFDNAECLSAVSGAY